MESSDTLTESERALKKQIVAELRAYVHDVMYDKLYDRLYEDIVQEMDRRIRLYNTQSANVITNELDRKLSKLTKFNNDKQLAIVSEQRELITKLEADVGSKVFEQVITEINERLVPKLNNMVQWVNYNTQDGTEVVDRFRRAVEIQPPAGGIKLLSNDLDKRVISPYVRTMFADD